MAAVEPSVIYVLSRDRFREMLAKDPYLAYVLSKVCVGYDAMY